MAALRSYYRGMSRDAINRVSTFPMNEFMGYQDYSTMIIFLVAVKSSASRV